MWFCSVVRWFSSTCSAAIDCAGSHTHTKLNRFRV
jgi:hypothetical protein